MTSQNKETLTDDSEITTTCHISYTIHISNLPPEIPLLLHRHLKMSMYETKHLLPPVLPVILICLHE